MKIKGVGQFVKEVWNCWKAEQL